MKGKTHAQGWDMLSEYDLDVLLQLILAVEVMLVELGFVYHFLHLLLELHTKSEVPQVFFRKKGLYFLVSK
jgi:hypothetical protein